MGNLKAKFVILVLIAIFYSFAMQAQVNATIRAKPVKAQFNRSIEELVFAKDQTGRNVLRMKIGLQVLDKTEDRVNMNFDILISVKGRLRQKIEQSVVKGGAITCAVTCAGKCPSIFGDGICTGCGCRYDNWITWAFGEAQSGDVFQVKIAPARGGAQDNTPNDDTKRISWKPVR
jgi:hypothetical protein